MNGRGPGEPSANPGRAVYEHQIERYREKKAAAKEKEDQQNDTAIKPQQAATTSAAMAIESPAKTEDPPRQALVARPADQRMARLCAINAEQFDTFRRRMTVPDRFALATGLSPQQHEVLIALVAPPADRRGNAADKNAACDRKQPRAA